ncbi:MAG: photosynthetic reaction center cytochrome c subunit [Acidobacteriota bacterium]|nr:photosynthetic reaction center cytochrome c subunit [Acidobacteriota bacterium]
MSSQNLGRNIRLALVALFACLFAASWTLKSSAQQPAAAGRPQQQQQLAPDAPAEQVYKNIQVLKGMPANQLSDTMDFFNTSLGVRCDFCHARNAAGNGLDFTSDAKEEKKAARRMIQMQVEMNSHHLADFGGERISCYTCHRGSPDPARYPTLPVVAPPPPPQNRAPGQPGAQGQSPQTGAPVAGGGQGTAVAPLPSAEEVLNKYVAAVGGREAIAKVKSYTLHGTGEGTRGGAQPFDATIVEPDKFLVVMMRPGQGQNPPTEMRQAYNGAHGWMKGARGTSEMSAAQLADMREAALSVSALKIAEPFTQMRVRGRRRIDDREVLVLEAKPSPTETQRFYFDTQTGLLVRQLTLRETFLQTIPEQIDYEDYHDVGGIKLPFTVRVSGVNPNATTTRKFTEIKLNAPVDDSIFVMPTTPKP